jgi:seryl-tRNA synthetase
MIDPRLLREDPDRVAAALARRGFDASAVQRLRDLDERRRELIAGVDAARAEQRTASASIGKASPDERPALIEAASQHKQRVADLEEQLAVVTAEYDAAFAASRTCPTPRPRRSGGRRGGAARGGRAPDLRPRGA